MSVLPMQFAPVLGFAPSGQVSGLGVRWAERRQQASRTLRRASQVAAVLALGGMLHAMRWASVLVL